MKQFRGTLLALLALVVLVGAYLALRPPPDAPKPVKKGDKAPEGVALFAFEKADLVKVEVTRADGTITLVERPDSWWIEGTEMRASRQMVNRVKHQLHDLVSRATVADATDEGALYGLGGQAIHVKLTMRDGTTHEFDAGDPNPSGVSFYLRKTGEDTVYTVKKSAVDYYSLSLAEFREHRFASFDSKDVDGIDATLPGGKRLKIQRTDERQWDLVEPVAFAANDMEVRGLLGRVSAMKAIKFVEGDAPPLAPYGLDQPRATIRITFSGGKEPLTLLVGKPSGENDGEYPLAYVKLAEEPFVYQVRDVFLEDYERDPAELRLRQFARMEQNDLAQIVSTFAPPDADDKDLAGTVTVRQAASEWQWDDGVIVPGSTPRRVASRACDIESDTFVADHGDDATYGFDHPIAKVVLTDQSGKTSTLLLGKPGPSKMDAEAHEVKRWYAKNAAFPEVYLVDDGLVDVLRDLHREHGRHATGEAAEEERKAKIDAEERAKREVERQERIEKRKEEKEKGKEGGGATP
jgi:hypothetical protein